MSSGPPTHPAALLVIRQLVRRPSSATQTTRSVCRLHSWAEQATQSSEILSLDVEEGLLEATR